MEMLFANYKLIFGVLILIILLGFGAWKFITQPSTKQKEQIKKVLLILVTEAERIYGSRTGKLKLSYVYSELIIKLPYLKYVPLSTVEMLIEETLEEMRHLLETNPKVAQIVNKEIQ